MGDGSAGEKEKDMKETKDQKIKGLKDHGTRDHQSKGLLQEKLGRHPAELRQYSDHLEKVAASLSDHQ
jgi:hypothetical protein